MPHQAGCCGRVACSSSPFSEIDNQIREIVSSEIIFFVVRRLSVSRGSNQLPGVRWQQVFYRQYVMEPSARGGASMAGPAAGVRNGAGRV
jgi:hypothetical protein